MEKNQQIKEKLEILADRFELNDKPISKVYYKSWMLDGEQLEEIDNLVEQGLECYELNESSKYSHVVIGKSELLEEVIDVIQY